jgi:hypothetical protein
MNEKIRKLAEQAGLEFDDDLVLESEPIYYTSQKDLEKFAELIVAECIAITDDLVNRNVDGTWTSTELYTDYNGALSEVKRRIEEHFGDEL